MGEVANMIVNGEVCQECGMFIDELPGYSVTCLACRKYNAKESGAGKVNCPQGKGDCGREK